MEIGLLIKTYSENRANLLFALSYVNECSSDFTDAFSDFFIDDFELRLAILKRIHTDIKDINIVLDTLKRIEKSESLKNYNKKGV